MWNYIPSPESADDDMTVPGYFSGMEGHIHAGDMVVIATAKAVRQMAFAIGEQGIVTVPMAQANMPQSNMDPMPQELPMGTQPTSGAESGDSSRIAGPEVEGTHEAVSQPVAEHMEHNGAPQTPPSE